MSSGATSEPGATSHPEGRDRRDMLARYTPAGETEATDLARVRELVSTVQDPWRRDTPLHLTASALIVHPPSGRVLLRWHGRHLAWFQVGGHADPGEYDPLEIALREAEEETALADLTPWPDAKLRHLVIVDVPAGNGEPAHQHADLRFVLATRRPETARPEHPANPLRWLTLRQAEELTSEDNLRETLHRLRRLVGRSPAAHRERTRALVIVDVQNDFCEGGSLAVTGGTAVARATSAYLASPEADQYAHIVATQDYHVDPGEHFSATPDFSVSWPPHCVAGTSGAEFHPALDTTRIEAVFRKGAHTAAYSGFEGTDDSGTGLAQWLHQHAVTDVDVAGIATDYCVKDTAADAIRAGLGTRVLLGLTAGIDDETTRRAIAEMRQAGAEVTGSRAQPSPPESGTDS